VTGVIRSGVANGASAIAHTLDTGVAFSTAGAKLLSVKNNGTEKAAIDKDGTLTLVTPLARDQIATKSIATSTYAVAVGGWQHTGDTNITDVDDGAAHTIDVSITTSARGNPVVVMVAPPANGKGNFGVTSDGGGARRASFYLYRDVGAAVISACDLASPVSSAVEVPGSFTFIDTTVSASTAYNYKLQASINNGAGTVYLTSVKLFAYEL
jgi:hypothetical protein